jgi:Cu-Zn family superoxide dismutase
MRFVLRKEINYIFGVASYILAISEVNAAEMTVNMQSIVGPSSASIGTVTMRDTNQGLQLDVKLSGISDGEHGFHIHQNASCEPGLKNGKVEPGLSAGDHFDPDATKSHKGPTGGGHKGDLAKLMSTGGKVDYRFIAPRLNLSSIIGRSLIVHEGGDTYADKPESGGGKGRIACGIIQ